MSNDASKRLLEVIRDGIEMGMRADGVQPTVLAHDICRYHPEVVEPLGLDLARKHIANMIRSELKKWSSIGSAEERQLVLPGMHKALLQDLPASVSIPTEDGEFVWRPLLKTTMSELRQHIALLTAQIRNDTKSRDAQQELLDRLVFNGATDDMTVRDALALLQEAAE